METARWNWAAVAPMGLVDVPAHNLMLQPWPCKWVLRRVPPTVAIAQPRGSAAAEQSPVQPCWSRRQASLAAGPSPELRLPLIYGWGSHCPFSPPFPLTSPPEPPQLPPAGTSACSTRNCPVGARFSSDTQGLKIVTILHPIGPSICCLIYE